MLQAINPVNILSFSHNTSKRQTKNDTNPITRVGEASLATKTTFFGGLALGARLLLELFDDGFVFEHAANKAGKIVEKNHKSAGKWSKNFLKAGAFIGLIGAGVCGFALFYTLLNAPKIAYKSKLSTFKKGKDMDVYISANNAEKELYTQLNKKAQTADESEKQKLREQYMQLRVAKNDVPDWVRLKK